MESDFPRAAQLLQPPIQVYKQASLDTLFDNNFHLQRPHFRIIIAFVPHHGPESTHGGAGVLMVHRTGICDWRWSGTCPAGRWGTKATALDSGQWSCCSTRRTASSRGLPSPRGTPLFSCVKKALWFRRHPLSSQVLVPMK